MSSSSNKIVLISSDGKSFEIEEAAARQIEIIANMIDNDCANTPIPLQNVTGPILAIIVEYCKVHTQPKHVLDDDKVITLNSLSIKEEEKNEQEAKEEEKTEQEVKEEEQTEQEFKEEEQTEQEVKEEEKTEQEAVSTTESDKKKKKKKKKKNLEEEKLREWPKKPEEFDAELKKLDIVMIFEIVTAANYLCIKSLLDLTCKVVADCIKDKPVDEIREIFMIEDDLTPEEHAKLREENPWAYE